MNLSPRWVDYLKAAGHDATHWSSVGRADATDAEIMVHASSNGMVVLSHDLDFGTMIAPPSPGTVTLSATDSSRSFTGGAVGVGSDLGHRAYFGGERNAQDHFGYIEPGKQAVFGRSYAAEPDVLIEQLRGDTAIAAADTLLLTVPNQLGVDYNAHVIEAILRHVAPALGWR